MQLVRAGRWMLELDIDATRVAYGRYIDWNDCDCMGCANYQLAIPELLQTKAALLLAELGIDMRAPAELGHLYAPTEQSVLVCGWFYAFGRIVSGGDCWPGQKLRAGPPIMKNSRQ